MLTQEILDNVPDNTTITNWSDIVPSGHPDFWQMPGLLRTLASLSLYWKKTERGWLKLDTEMVYYEILYGYT